MDGTEERKDETQTTDTSSETKETSKGTETYTKESQVKAISDALSAAGRTDKDATEKTQKATSILEDAKKIRDSAAGERDRWQKEKDERELESARDDPEKLSAIEERRRHRETKDKLTSIVTELEDTKGKLLEAGKKSAEYTKEQNAREIAARLKVDYKPLMLTDGSKEVMENLAKALPKLEDKSTEGIHADSGATIGGNLSNEKFLADFASGKIAITEENMKRAGEITKSLKGNIV